MSVDAPKLTRLCGADELEENEVLQVELEDIQPLAVYRLSDGYFVTDDTCTHGAASLSDGEIEDGEIECPFHSGCFDIRTGRATEHPCTIPIKTYPVTICDGDIFTDLTEGRIMDNE